MWKRERVSRSMYMPSRDPPCTRMQNRHPMRAFTFSAFMNRMPLRKYGSILHRASSMPEKIIAFVMSIVVSSLPGMQPET